MAPSAKTKDEDGKKNDEEQRDAAAVRIQKFWQHVRLRRALFRRALQLASSGRGSGFTPSTLDRMQRQRVGHGWLGLIGRIENEFQKVSETRPAILRDVRAVKELTWGEPATVGEALQRIFALSANQFARQSLVHAGAVPMLLGVVRKQKSGPGRLRALRTLANLVDDCPEGAMELAAASSPRELRAAIGASDDVEEDQTGYRILSGAAACKAVNLKWTTSQGLLDIILADLKDPYRKNAYSIGPAKCLARCCSFSENHKAVEAGGGFNAVKELCKHPNEELKLHGLECVVGLQNMVEMRRRLLELGFLKIILPLIESSGAVRRESLRAVSRFAPITASHEALVVRLGPIADAAHDPIEADPAAKHCAAIALAFLVSSPVCGDRADVQRAGRTLLVFTDPAYAKGTEEERELFEAATRAMYPERAKDLLKSVVSKWGGFRRDSHEEEQRELERRMLAAGLPLPKITAKRRWRRAIRLALEKRARDGAGGDAGGDSAAKSKKPGLSFKPGQLAEAAQKSSDNSAALNRNRSFTARSFKAGAATARSIAGGGATARGGTTARQAWEAGQTTARALAANNGWETAPVGNTTARGQAGNLTSRTLAARDAGGTTARGNVGNTTARSFVGLLSARGAFPARTSQGESASQYGGSSSDEEEHEAEGSEAGGRAPLARSGSARSALVRSGSARSTAAASGGLARSGSARSAIRFGAAAPPAAAAAPPPAAAADARPRLEPSRSLRRVAAPAPSEDEGSPLDRRAAPSAFPHPETAGLPSSPASIQPPNIDDEEALARGIAMSLAHAVSAPALARIRVGSPASSSSGGGTPVGAIRPVTPSSAPAPLPLARPVTLSPVPLARPVTPSAVPAPAALARSDSRNRGRPLPLTVPPLGLSTTLSPASNARPASSSSSSSTSTVPAPSNHLPPLPALLPLPRAPFNLPPATATSYPQFAVPPSAFPNPQAFLAPQMYPSMPPNPPPAPMYPPALGLPPLQFTPFAGFASAYPPFPAPEYPGFDPMLPSLQHSASSPYPLGLMQFGPTFQSGPAPYGTPYWNASPEGLGRLGMPEAQWGPPPQQLAPPATASTKSYSGLTKVDADRGVGRVERIKAAAREEYALRRSDANGSRGFPFLTAN